MLSVRVVRDALAPDLSKEALSRVKRACEARTLREALAVQRRGDGRWFLGVPHYWSVYYHDGRGPARPRNSRYLVWFPDPRDDPRHRGQFPVRYSEVRRLDLDPDEFRQLVADGKMVVALASPRGRAPQGSALFDPAFQTVPGQQFFDQGLRGFFATGGSKGAVTRFKRLLKDDQPELFQKRTRKVRITV